MTSLKRELSPGRSFALEGMTFEEFYEIVESILRDAPKGRPRIDADYVPKTATNVRLDEDVIRWLRSLGPNHFSRINAILRALAVMDPRFEFLDDE